MGEADLEAVVCLEKEAQTSPWNAEMFRQELRNPLAHIDLLWCAGRLAGYLCSLFVAGELHILNVVTSPEMRRRGVAYALVRHVLQRSLRQGLEAAFLEVRYGNQAAIALYEEFGFRPGAVRRNYYSDGEDALLMKLEPPFAAGLTAKKDSG